MMAAFRTSGPVTVTNPARLRVALVLAQGAHTCLQLFGELDVATARDFTEALDQEFERGRRNVHLDVSGLDFIDCAGLRAVVEAHNRCLSRRGALVLTHVGPPTARLLHITGLVEALFIGNRPVGPRGA